MGQGHTECAFGTGNALLRYGIDTRCAKQPPVVRDAFSSEALGAQKRFYGTEEMFGAKTRLLGYATHLQRPAEQPTPQTVDSLLPTGRISSARNGPRSNVSRHKKRVTSSLSRLFSPLH